MWERLCCRITLEDVKQRNKYPVHIWILQGESREFPKAGGFLKKKAGNLQDAGEHKAGGGGGRHTRVWWVSCQLTRQKLSVQPEKMCVSFNFQPKYPKKTTDTLHIQAWIQDRNFRAAGGCASTDGVKEMKSISRRRGWMKRGAGRELRRAGGDGGTDLIYATCVRDNWKEKGRGWGRGTNREGEREKLMKGK